MDITVKTVSAFTIDGTGGNIAGLVLDADSFTKNQKQLIAAKAGFSETAFVSKSNVADFKLDFFTPTRQIAHCGHATIATFSYLKSNGFIDSSYSSKETVDGVRQIYFQGNDAFMEQKPGMWSYADDDREIAMALNTPLSSMVSIPVIVNTGNSFLLVEVESTAMLESLMPNFSEITRLSKKYHLIGFYLYVKTPKSEVVATTRMFAPLYGINEESATGMAAGPLGWWLYSQDPSIGQTFTIRQGEFMEKPSASDLNVRLNVENAQIPNLFVGGEGTLQKEIALSLTEFLTK